MRSVVHVLLLSACSSPAPAFSALAHDLDPIVQELTTQAARILGNGNAPGELFNACIDNGEPLSKLVALDPAAYEQLGAELSELQDHARAILDFARQLPSSCKVDPKECLGVCRGNWWRFANSSEKLRAYAERHGAKLTPLFAVP